MQIHILGSDDKPEIEIYQGSEKIIHTKIDSEVSAFRINCLNVKRVFSVYEEVVKRQSYTVLLNEYSQPLGKIEKDKLLDQTGVISVEDLRLNYRIRNTDQNIQIYLAEHNTEALKSSIDANTYQSLGAVNESILLFSLCWYAYLVKKKQDVLSLA